VGCSWPLVWSLLVSLLGRRNVPAPPDFWVWMVLGLLFMAIIGFLSANKIRCCAQQPCSTHCVCCIFGSHAGSVPSMDNPLIGLRALRDISDVDLARLSGVSRSTLNRIERGTVQPTLRSLREIAIAAGLDVEVSYRPLSDPAAARAARHILDDTFAAVTMSDHDRGWIARLGRIAGDYPVAIVETAGIAASLLHRPGVIGITEPLSPLRLASAGDAAGGHWAISGASALNLIANGPEVISGPEVLYVDDVERAWRLLEAPPRSHPEDAAVILAPYGDEHSIDAWMSGPLQLVAPVQLLLDSVGLSGDIAELALTTARSW